MAGVGSCPWCEIPCMERILIWPRVSGLWPRSYMDWEAASEAERGHHTSPPTHLDTDE